VARPRFTYSRWDGTQRGFEPTADDVLSQITDDLVEHGDLGAALRRLLQNGFEGADGERFAGIRELLQRLAEQRRNALDRYDLGGVYDDIAQELREVVDLERRALDDLVDQAAASGDDRNAEVARGAAESRAMELDLLPPDLAGMVKSLQEYDFTSAEAQQRFEALVEQLRQQLVQQMVDQMAGAMSGMTPEDLARMKDMMAELNQMLEERAAGREPDFDGFMQRYGDFFPENPKDLDELLEVMARRMAAMQAMLNSMTPEQRAQLQGLADQLLEDMDLRWQVDQLSSNLRDLFPDAGWDQRYQFQGSDPLQWGQAAEILEQLGDLDQLDNLLRGAVQPGALADVDVDRVRDLLGDDAAQSVQQLAELSKVLEDAGYLEHRDGTLEMTPRAIRKLAGNALGEVFRKLAREMHGRHDLEQRGLGHERDVDTKPYEFGDPFNLHIERTMRNAVRRAGVGTPVQLLPEDFEVERTEHQVRSSTVLLLDLSLSMPMRGNFLPAKKVALALYALISSQFPRDELSIIGFGKYARSFRVEDLPKVSWDFDYGTNMQHALQLARQQLGARPGNKQILMITDGEPTAHLLADGSAFFMYPPIAETRDLTLREVMRCTRDGIRINTFMLDPDWDLRHFVEEMTRLNRGRAFFTSPDNLGEYVLVDFLEQRRELLRRRAG
jgi:uncharacterized protein with von Willebrand factor type A (vWA) domain